MMNAPSKRWPIISTRAGAVTVGLMVAAVFFLASLPMSAMNMSLFVLYIFPFALLIITAVAGFIPAAASLAVVLAGLAYAYQSAMAAAFGAAYLAPSVIVLAVALWKRLPFWRTCALMLGINTLALLALFLLLQRISGGNFVHSGTEAVMRWIDTMPDRDNTLYVLWKSNLLTLDSRFEGHVFHETGTAWLFTQEALSELYNQIRLRVSIWLRTLFPGLISMYSIYLACAGTGAAIFYGRRHAQRVAFIANDDALSQLYSGIKMPEFSSWHIPRRAGNMLWVLALGYLLTRGTQNNMLYLSGGLMYNAFTAVYTIQGLSMINGLQKKRGTRPRLRGITIVLCFLFLQSLLMIAGIFDQLLDPRKLRKKDTDSQNEAEPPDRRV